MVLITAMPSQASHKDRNPNSRKLNLCVWSKYYDARFPYLWYHTTLQSPTSKRRANHHFPRWMAAQRTPMLTMTRFSCVGKTTELVSSTSNGMGLPKRQSEVLGPVRLLTFINGIEVNRESMLAIQRYIKKVGKLKSLSSKSFSVVGFSGF